MGKWGLQLEQAEPAMLTSFLWTRAVVLRGAVGDPVSFTSAFSAFSFTWEKKNPLYSQCFTFDWKAEWHRFVFVPVYVGWKPRDGNLHPQVSWRCPELPEEGGFNSIPKAASSPLKEHPGKRAPCLGDLQNS